MSTCSPQRFLANDRNVVRTATLTPNSVQPYGDGVDELLQPRDGTAQVVLTGDYTGAEEALYDVKVVDTSIATPLTSAPIATGEGTATLSNVTATGAAQQFTVQLNDSGTPAHNASLDFEGVRVVAKATGAAGNALGLTINQSTLVFTPTAYSLLAPLTKGAGGATSPLTGSAFDWNAAVLDSNANVIPSTAHRVAFGEDKSFVYLQYKQFVKGEWQYFLVPELQRDIPAGTVIHFVTGGRTVTVTDGNPLHDEPYTSIVTDYDLLNALKTTSALVTVIGVVANDRSPTGQASRELLVRTDARAEPSSGTGSDAAQGGFTDVAIFGPAATELITAKCTAVIPSQYPTATLGHERWSIKGSVSGDLGSFFTGDLFTDPSGKFALRIPVSLPTDNGSQRGRLTYTLAYATRSAGVENPPICPVARSLGPNAQDQTITLRYTKRPSGNCKCSDMPIPNIGGPCLGDTDEGGSVAYSSDVLAKLKALYLWQADTIRAHSSYATVPPSEDPFIGANSGLANATPAYASITESLFKLVTNYELAIAQIDPVSGGTLRADALTVWDAAVSELQGDVAGASATVSGSYVAAEALVSGNAVGLFLDGTGAIKVAKANASCFKFGYVTAGFSAGATATVFFTGRVTGATPGTFTVGTSYTPSNTTPGNWITGAGVITAATPAVAVTTSDLQLPATAGTTTQTSVLATYWALLADRYEARLMQSLIYAGIPQAGKSDADILQSGDGCWQDYPGEAFYWTVTGSGGALGAGTYAPAFNNHVYYSSRDADQSGRYFSTHEFAFQINVKCPANLLEGDEIIFTIGGAAYSATYQVGDTESLAIIAAAPLQFAGGQDGSPQQTWNVTGSSSGPQPNFVVADPTVPTTYSASSLLGFTWNPGGIPSAKGDKFVLNVEGAHYEWRRSDDDGVTWGSWSSALAVPAAPAAFDRGLSIAFATGSAPSFAVNDTWRFRARQPWAASNLFLPTPEPWKWSGSGGVLVIDAGAPVDADMAAVAFHTLPSTAVVTLEGGTTAGVYTWSESIPWRAGVMQVIFAAQQTSRYFRLTITNATDGAIGWLPIGIGLKTTLSASMDLRPAAKIDRATAGLFDTGRTLGRGVNGTVEWSEGALSESDAAALQAMWGWVKDHDDEYVIFVPNVTRPEVLLAQISSDELSMPDIFGFEPNAGFGRRHSTQISLTGALQ